MMESERPMSAEKKALLDRLSPAKKEISTGVSAGSLSTADCDPVLWLVAASCRDMHPGRTPRTIPMQPARSSGEVLITDNGGSGSWTGSSHECRSQLPYSRMDSSG